MSRKSFTRRQALALGGAAVAGIWLAGPAEGAADDSRGRLKAYLRSARGRRASRALKIRNANLRYKTKLAAARHRLHRGDHSRIVSIDISLETKRLWFPRGEHVVDLRNLKGRA
jgi:hypothetical protein